MQQESSTGSQIADYFKNAGDLLSSESEVITVASQTLMARKGFVSNKDLIVYLLDKLESESNVVQLDIYRNALEIVVQRTPDDILTW